MIRRHPFHIVWSLIWSYRQHRRGENSAASQSVAIHRSKRSCLRVFGRRHAKIQWLHEYDILYCRRQFIIPRNTIKNVLHVCVGQRCFEARNGCRIRQPGMHRNHSYFWPCSSEIDGLKCATKVLYIGHSAKDGSHPQYCTVS